MSAVRVIGDTIEVHGRVAAFLKTDSVAQAHLDLVEIVEAGVPEQTENEMKAEAIEVEVTDLRDTLMGIGIDAATTPEEIRESMTYLAGVTATGYVDEVRGEIMSLLSAVRGRLDADRLLIEEQRREIGNLKDDAATRAESSITPPAAALTTELLEASAGTATALQARIAELEADLAAATEANKRLTSQAGSHALETGKAEDLLRAEIDVRAAREKNLEAQLAAAKAKIEQVETHAAKALAKGKVITFEIADDNLAFNACAARLFTHLIPRVATLDKPVQAIVKDMAKSFG